ncbi:MAG: hypothetical protein A2600_07760 [Candidatus Lambdaproteobacteria bacterium RIFOXYD1_FULL_56_27]|uniref:Radical SAM core domain-containing protein n=1 Tax=Candidatus Lambdaproteobacteria bacterium RIFOXYD2_FULL_56_26 TaxID=1817773 RepID=A0A1F6GNP4_9PROT|nr:MAG: hypothetical protein A2557_05985 [Candidatus Lambdaproteobacteria bacterium RIFOXYD2_FULL_56_26]OGG99854.1 MAG: hypothetical protein A2426_09715 [Candidatus Lambdaproteobacteria bacterium RIFOXYC1_FULL_56_13]OGH09669.1 MAG: hypothetical protein A2600_07760 [Candidatus Lambdaproteobacteria bacterium RIFOXYD1_FULL_56_27]
MKILLLVPPSPDHKRIIRNIDCSHEAKADYLWQPNDLMLISALAKAEDEVRFVDGTADRMSREEFFTTLGHESWDLFVFCLSSAAWASDFGYFQETRALFPMTPAYVLGDIFLEKPYQEIILKEAEGIVILPHQCDLTAMAAPGEKNRPLPGVMTQVGQNVLGPPTKPVYSELGSPRHELFLKPGYIFPFARHYKYATVTLMWGCPFSCSYCSDAHFPPVVRTPESVLSELESLEKLGVKELFFADKTFGFPQKNSMPLLEAMAKRFKFSWSCYFHPQHYDPVLLDAMVAAGCHTLIIGVDSANLDSLSVYKRHVSENKLLGLVRHADKKKVDVCADFIIGLAHETLEDVKLTLDFALSLPLDYASFNIAAPLPGSVIRQEALESGLLTIGSEGFDTLGHSGVLASAKIDSAALLKLRRKAVLKFYLRPSYLWRRLSRLSSLEHLTIQMRQAVGLFTKS